MTTQGLFIANCSIFRMVTGPLNTRSIDRTDICFRPSFHSKHRNEPHNSTRPKQHCRSRTSRNRRELLEPKPVRWFRQEQFRDRRRAGGTFRTRPLLLANAPGRRLGLPKIVDVFVPEPCRAGRGGEYFGVGAARRHGQLFRHTLRQATRSLIFGQR